MNKALTEELNVAIEETKAFNLERTEKHKNRGH